MGASVIICSVSKISNFTGHLLCGRATRVKNYTQEFVVHSGDENEIFIRLYSLFWLGHTLPGPQFDFDCEF
jgi:hypothetical protein